MEHSFFYQICDYPTSQDINKYNVRKFIFYGNRIVSFEDYTYNRKNLNKLNKFINSMEHKFKTYETDSLENIPFPVC